MIEITVQRTPAGCPACDQPVKDASATDCVRCGKAYHVRCWDEGGCRVCPPTTAGKPKQPAEPPPAPEPEERHHGHKIPSGEEPRWLDDHRNVMKAVRVFWGVCALVLLIDVLDLLGVGYHKHPHFDAERLPGFYGIYGFVACVALVLLAKQLRKVVMRGEHYYDE